MSESVIEVGKKFFSDYRVKTDQNLKVIIFLSA